MKKESYVKLRSHRDGRFHSLDLTTQMPAYDSQSPEIHDQTHNTFTFVGNIF